MKLVTALIVAITLAALAISMAPAQAQSPFAAENEILRQMMTNAQRELDRSIREIGRPTYIENLQRQVNTTIRSSTRQYSAQDYSAPRPPVGNFSLFVDGRGNPLTCMPYYHGCAGF